MISKSFLLHLLATIGCTLRQREKRGLWDELSNGNPKTDTASFSDRKDIHGSSSSGFWSSIASSSLHDENPSYLSEREQILGRSSLKRPSEAIVNAQEDQEKIRLPDTKKKRRFSMKNRYICK